MYEKHIVACHAPASYAWTVTAAAAAAVATFLLDLGYPKSTTNKCASRAYVHTKWQNIVATRT